MALPKIAVVGRPNVGKSTLFNRIIGERLSITDDMPGVTRDRIYSKASWLGKEFALIDTGGIEIENVTFQTEIKEQALIAIDEADVIVFLTDCRNGVTADDEAIAKILYKTDKPVILAINKVDNDKFLENLYEFYSLGFGEPIGISSAHGIGVGDLLDRVISELPKKEDNEYDEGIIKFCVVGRPNVGKSSLTNTILGKNRVIVSNIEGTTRDSIDTAFKKDGKDYVIIDTAGIRKKGKIYENSEKYSILRALSSIERSDVCLIVIDAERGIIEQDKHVAQYVYDAHKACVIVVNKWDTVEKNDYTMNEWIEKIRVEFQFLPYAQICFISAKENKRISTIFPHIDKAYESYNKRVSTSLLNDVLTDAVAMNPAPNWNGGRGRFYYATQVGVACPCFVLFVNNPEFVHFSYVRYLENCMRNSFDFEGTPIKLMIRKRD